MPPSGRSTNPFVRVVTVLAVAVALLAGCGPAGPTATPVPTAPPTPAASVDQAAIYATIERQVEAIRELKPTRTVDPILLDAVALKRTLAEASAQDTSAEELAMRGRLLIALGLLPAGSDLAALMSDFQNSQVAGFYLPQDGRLYVVSRGGGLGPIEKTTFAHEYTHALQDQHFPLLQQLGVDKVPHGDQDLGQLALIEGDATVSMTYWARDHLSPIELIGLLGASLDPGQLAALNSMPAFLRDTALFPYQAGAQFATTIQLQAGWDGVNAVFNRPPDSTEQILHLEKYSLREKPVAVTLHAALAAAMGAGWSLDSEDTLGEFQLGAWLTDSGGSKLSAQQTTAATTAAAGWGGDRVALFRGPAGAWAVLLRTVWDSEADASQFLDAATATLKASGRAGMVVRVKNPKEIWVVLGSDGATVTQAEAAVRIPN